MNRTLAKRKINIGPFDLANIVASGTDFMTPMFIVCYKVVATPRNGKTWV